MLTREQAIALGKASQKKRRERELSPDWVGGSHEKDGRIMICKPGHPKARNRYVSRAIFVAETAFGGLLPKGTIVHHVNGNTREDANTNLVICQNQGYHAFIHARTRVFLAGGKPSIQKICTTCHTLKNKTEFYLDRRSGDLLTGICKSCVHVRNSNAKKIGG